MEKNILQFVLISNEKKHVRQDAPSIVRTARFSANPRFLYIFDFRFNLLLGDLF